MSGTLAMTRPVCPFLACPLSAYIIWIELQFLITFLGKALGMQGRTHHQLFVPWILLLQWNLANFRSQEFYRSCHCNTYYIQYTRMYVEPIVTLLTNRLNTGAIKVRTSCYNSPWSTLHPCPFIWETQHSMSNNLHTGLTYHTGAIMTY